MQSRDRFRGALLGLAAGDALGTTLEFRPPGSFSPITDLVGGGPFDLTAGAWTDDTSMALCLGESLLEAGFDPADQLRRYVRWYRDGHWSSTGECFDIGGATRAALERFERTGEQFPGDAAPTAAGNGTIMRLAPVAMASARDPDEAEARAAESARTTHGAPQAIDATRWFARLLVAALTGDPSLDAALAGTSAPGAVAAPPADLHPEVAEVAAGSFLHREPPVIQGSGYVVRSLEAALWALRSSADFATGALLAANLGDDADTTAAVYGQLAGARYGAEGIPAAWRAKLVRGNEITAMADALRDRAGGEPAGASGDRGRG